MRAMGGGRSFSTSIVRGMGLVVEYSTSLPTPIQGHNAWVPSRAADQVRRNNPFGPVNCHKCW